MICNRLISSDNIPLLRLLHTIQHAASWKCKKKAAALYSNRHTCKHFLHTILLSGGPYKCPDFNCKSKKRIRIHFHFHIVCHRYLYYIIYLFMLMHILHFCYSIVIEWNLLQPSWINSFQLQAACLNSLHVFNLGDPNTFCSNNKTPVPH